MSSKLLFVYNAKSDALNAAFDFAHKIISPKTYSCSLCKLTYGAFSEKKAWKEFREKSDLEMEFLHIDEFEENYPKNNYPTVLKKNGNQLKVLVSPEELNEISSVEELIITLESKEKTKD